MQLLQARMAVMVDIIADIVKHDAARVQQQARTAGDDIIFPDLIVPEGTQPARPDATRHMRQDRDLGCSGDTRTDREPRVLPAEELLAPQLHPAGRQERHIRDALHGHHRRHHVHRARIPRHVPNRVRVTLDPPLGALARPGRRAVLDHRLLVHVCRHTWLVFPAAALHPSPGAAVGAHLERRESRAQPQSLGPDEVFRQAHDFRTQDQSQ